MDNSVPVRSGRAAVCAHVVRTVATRHRTDVLRRQRRVSAARHSRSAGCLQLPPVMDYLAILTARMNYTRYEVAVVHDRTEGRLAHKAGIPV